MSFEVRGVCPLLQVYDMPTAVHFYRDLLGFELVRNSPVLSTSPDDFHWALLKRDGTEVMLNTAYDEGERPANPDRARVAAHGDTILYFGCPDVDAAFQHLRDLGLKMKEPSVSHGMKGIHFEDPNGYGLTFHWPA